MKRERVEVRPAFVYFNELPAYGVPAYSRVHIYRMMRRGQFPAQIQISDNRVGWRLSAIQDWVATRPLSAKVAPDAAD
jgi:predicted DNA-binding transcriptional regulator AlpA